MTSQHPPIWNQLYRYLSSEDMQAIEESSILDYLRTKYDAPEENSGQDDLTEFIFEIQDRKVQQGPQYWFVRGSLCPPVSVEQSPFLL